MDYEKHIKSYRKDYKDYSDKIVIADASPLISLNAIDKLEYLALLFSEVYTTETVKKECRFNLPDWIKVEEPEELLKKALSKKGMDEGEKSAIALAMEKEVLRKRNIFKGNPCLILDDKRAEKIYQKWDLGIKNIKLRDIFSFAFDKKLFTREEGEKMLLELKDKGREFKKSDIMLIFNDYGNKRGNKI